MVEGELPAERKREMRARTRYEVRVRRPDGTEASRTFKTFELAESFEREQLRSRDLGAMHDSRAARILFRAWVEEWQELRRTVRPRTEEIDERNLRLYILPTFGAVELASINRTMVAKWIKSLDKVHHLAPASAHQAHRVLRAILSSAVTHGRLVANPAAGRDLAPTVAKRAPRIPTTAEVMELADIIDRRFRALVLVAAYCGLRRGELSGLRVDRVNLLARRLEVVEQVDRKGAVAPLKTDASRRTVPLPSVVVDALAAHYEAGHTTKDGYVFSGERGGRLDMATFSSRHYVPARRACGLGALRLHDLRHVCASVMIASGADLKAVQSVMGHASAVETLDLYGHLFPGQLDDLAARMDALIASSPISKMAAVSPLFRASQ